MPNQFLIIIDPQAGGRLQEIIAESSYDDDCGILDNVRCITTNDALDTVISRVSAAAEPRKNLSWRRLPRPGRRITRPRWRIAGG